MKTVSTKTQRAITKPQHAFTLVELLVVIGIIALLISILLPSLNRARQQANLIDCSSRLRQMGMALQIYESENNNLIPMGSFVHTPVPSNMENYWWWQFTLGDILNRNMISSTDGLVHNLSKVFADLDTVPGVGYRWTCDYAANPRVFYSSAMDCGLCTTTPYYPTDAFGNNINFSRKLTDVRNASNVFAIWDAPQCVNIDNATTYNAYPVPEAIDAWAWYNNGMALTNATTIQPSLAIWPIAAGGGSSGLSDGKAAQKKYNGDLPTYDIGPAAWEFLRFRHMNNTELAALCLDGHVETRAVGTVTRKDIYTNAPGTH